MKFNMNFLVKNFRWNFLKVTNEVDKVAADLKGLNTSEETQPQAPVLRRRPDKKKLTDSEVMERLSKLLNSSFIV